MRGKSLCISILLLWSTNTVGAGATAFDKVTRNLPDLHGAGRPQPGYFGLAEHSATLGYQSRQEKWDATVDRHIGVGLSVSFDYGRMLTNRFGAGGTLTRQSDTTEVVLNGIYAPKRNVRVRMTGAQLRTDGLYPSTVDGESDSLMQNSYLFGARKYWDKYEFLSDLGISAYTVAATAPGVGALSALSEADTPETDYVHQGTLAVGHMEGYMLNLNLHPTPQSSVELRREISHLTYYGNVRAQRNEQVASNRISYSQRFDHCMRFQGGYSAAPNGDHLDLRLAQNNWNVRLSHTQEGHGSDTALHIGYAIALDSSQRNRRDCGGMNNAPIFEPIIDAAMTRPQQFPREPLAIVETP